MEYYSAIKKHGIMPFAATWMDLERSYWVKEVRQRRGNNAWHLLYVDSKEKWYKWNLQNRKRPTDLEKNRGCQGEGWTEGIVRDFGMDMYTLLCLKSIPDKDLLDSTGNSIQLNGHLFCDASGQSWQLLLLSSFLHYCQHLVDSVLNNDWLFLFLLQVLY